jgi:hypothetical protein
MSCLLQLKPKVLNYTTGENMASDKLGKTQYIAQLNAAGRMVASMLGIHVADIEMMADGFTREQSLMDCHHPTSTLTRVSLQGSMCTTST